MILNRRGQGAMEYLMTYSWAILVVMLIGVALWQIGIFNLGGMTGTTYNGFSRIKPQLSLVKVTTDGDFSGAFTNGAGSFIEVVAVSGSCNFNLPSGPRINAGENFVINGSGCTVSAMKGDRYDITMDIDYNISVGSFWTTHTEHGVIHGPLE